MYNKKNLRKRILVARKLNEFYAEPGTKNRGEQYVCETYAEDILGIGYDTFTDYCKEGKYIFENNDLPLHVEAALKSLKRNKLMAEALTDGEIELWKVPYPEYRDLIDVIRDRRKRELEVRMKNERNKGEQPADADKQKPSCGMPEKEPVG